MSRIYALYKSIKDRKHSYLFCYTVLFCVFSLLVFWYFPLFHKSFIWQQDGLKQHYNGLLYYGKYLKTLVSGFLSGRGFHLPMWDFSIGYGSDIITTLHYYSIGDPLTLLSLFVPLSLMEYFYAFLFFLRAYIGGLGFSKMSLSRGNGRFYTMTGAFIYCFSAFGLVLGLMHGIFMVPVCYFPWIIYGVDRIFEKKSPLCFILSVAAAAAANFYFLYMEVLLAVLYICHKFICDEADRYETRQKPGVYAKDLLFRTAEFLLYGLNSFLLSAAVLLPVLYVMFSSERFAAEKYVPLLYSFKHYLQIAADFMITRRAGSWTLMGYTPVGALSVILMFAAGGRIREIKRQRIRFIILMIFAMVPFCGFMINGFAYVTNRWTFALALSTAMAVSSCLPLGTELEGRGKRRIGRFVMVLCYLSGAFFFVRSEESLLSYMILLLFSFIVLNGETPRGLFKPAIYICLTLSLFLNGWYAYSTADSGFLDEFKDFHGADKGLNADFPGSLLSDAGDGGFYRTEVAGVETVQNSSIQTGFKGTQFYFSLTSPYVSDFINSMYFNCPKDYDYDGVESRAGLEALASVKYFITGEDSLYKVPSGFSKLSEGEDPSGKKAILFKNDNVLSPGVAYDGYISRKSFDGEAVTGRQNALLTGAVVSDADAKELLSRGFGEEKTEDDSVNTLKNIEAKGDMDLSDNSFTVRRNASLTITFDGMEDAETYLIFKNLKFRGFKERERYDSGAWAGLTPYEQAKVNDKNTTDTRPSVTSLMVNHGGHGQVIEFYNYRNDFYCGRKNFLVNLGDTGKGEQKIEISFRESGVYSFDSLEVRAQPVRSITEKIDRLKENALYDVETGENTFSGKIKADRDKILMLSIPYSTGWRAFVDGEEKKVIRTGLMYTGLPLEKGEHSILLTYETPFIRLGAVFGVIGIIMLFVVYLVWCKKTGGSGIDSI